MVEIDKTLQVRADLDGGSLSSAEVPQLLAALRELTGASYIWQLTSSRRAATDTRTQTLTFVPMALGAGGLPALFIDLDAISRRLLGASIRARCSDEAQYTLLSRVLAWLTRCYPGLEEVSGGGSAARGLGGAAQA